MSNLLKEKSRSPLNHLISGSNFNPTPRKPFILWLCSLVTPSCISTSWPLLASHKQYRFSSYLRPLLRCFPPGFIRLLLFHVHCSPWLDLCPSLMLLVSLSKLVHCDGFNYQLFTHNMAKLLSPAHLLNPRSIYLTAYLSFHQVSNFYKILQNEVRIFPPNLPLVLYICPVPENCIAIYPGTQRKRLSHLCNFPLLCLQHPLNPVHLIDDDADISSISPSAPCLLPLLEFKPYDFSSGLFQHLIAVFSSMS